MFLFPRIYRAKHAVVTLPIGVLQNSPSFFNPQLNTEKVLTTLNELATLV